MQVSLVGASLASPIIDEPTFKGYGGVLQAAAADRIIVKLKAGLESVVGEAGELHRESAGLRVVKLGEGADVTAALEAYRQRDGKPSPEYSCLQPSLRKLEFLS
jgi:hypothetical protein